MLTQNRETAVQKITEMSEDRVAKLLLFMAGMEAEHMLSEMSEVEQTRNPPKQTA